jgi:hypothetical protein
MSNQVLAVYAVHERHRDEVCFIVIAESMDKMGRPLMAKYGKALWENYKPIRVAALGPAPDRDVGLVEVFGPRRSLPLN